MKKNNIVLSPSILSSDFSRLAEQIKIVEEAGADWIHLDVMDGHFVPNITFGPPVIEKIRKVTNLPLDAHLMIEEPQRYLKDFKNAGVDHLTIHVEVGYHVHRTIEQIHHLGMLAGITLNPATSVSAIENLIHFVDLILVMTVNPGFGGQQFISAMLSKIQKVAQLIDSVDHEIWLEVDGGLDASTISDVIQYGATALVIGSAIYHTNDVSATVKEFKKLMNKNGTNENHIS